jgi:predicted GIY-YIG superfamily endonuclease
VGSGPLRRDSTTARSSWTYLVRSSTGRAIYVGATNRPVARLAEHQRRARWWSLAAGIELRRHPDAEAARRAEADLIARL